MTIDINVKLDKNAKMPTKGHPEDGGFDLYTPEAFMIPAHGSYVVETGVHMEIPTGFVGFIKSKSGLNVKRGIQSEGVVDAGYTGSITVKLYNNSDTPASFEKHEKITQIVILPIPYIYLHEVSELGEHERGDSAFGSTGRF